VAAPSASKLPTARPAELIIGEHRLRTLGAATRPCDRSRTGEPTDDDHRCHRLHEPQRDKRSSAKAARLIGRAEAPAWTKGLGLPRLPQRRLNTHALDTHAIALDTSVNPHAERKRERADRNQDQAPEDEPPSDPAGEERSRLVHLKHQTSLRAGRQTWTPRAVTVELLDLVAVALSPAILGGHGIQAAAAQRP